MKKAVILVCVISIIAIAPFAMSAANTGGSNGLVSYWKFDEGSGTTVNDSFGTNHGALEGATWTSGLILGALRFDGIDDGVRIPDDTSLRPSHITYLAWIKPHSFANAHNEVMGFMRDPSGFRGSVVLFVDPSGRPALQMQNGSAAVVDIASNESLVPDNWAFLAATYDGSIVRLYVNGIERATAEYTGGIDYGAGPRELDIGGDLLGYPGWFDGIIDEVAIYDRALTPEVIQHHYENGLNGFGYDAPAYDWAGFFSPLDNGAVLNSVKAGAAVPVKFSLGGDYGLDILASAYPKWREIDCDTSAPVDGIEETVSAGA
ncbi:MAG: LamG domain-containing protein, partial [Chloroflexi bacterium]|nr:LamG domain-containing protein [Chloroflexota bacterium]